jgi:hypothetical protein
VPAQKIYKRRQPELTAIHKTVADNWLQFVQEAESRDATIPLFVHRAFEKYLHCGQLAAGFARVRCKSCADEHLVAFSCKTRGLCTSCDGKRMAEAAAHIVDNVFPEAAARQWVFTVPPWLRYKMAWDHKLAGKVLNIFVRTVTAWYRAEARQLGFDVSKCAAVSVLQRFGDGLRLSPHCHVIFADGAWVPSLADGSPQFIRAQPASQADIEDVLRSARRKVLRMLLKLGVVSPEEDDVGHDELADSELMLAWCSKASLLDRIAVGKRQGRLVARVRDEPPEPRPNGRLCAALDGFTVHAATTVATKDRPGLEKLCRYVCRPSFSVKRMELLPNGRIFMKFKSKWRDGSIGKVFEPMDLVAKLVPLVVKPRVNLLRYHGQFAGNAKWRSEICPTPNQPAPSTIASATTAEQRHRRRSWAEMLKRCFAIDVLKCPCGGEREVISTIKAGRVASKILRHLRQPTDLPKFRRARPPPEYFEAGFD